MNFLQLLREHTWFIILLALVIGFIWTIPGFYIKPYILLLVGSYKNYTLATVTALSLFGPVVALPAILYTFVNNILLIPMHFIFPKK